MTRKRFEEIAERALERLPDRFRSRIENVRIVVEDAPSAELAREHGGDRTLLLGLYTGIPLPHRTTWYGTSPTVPDTITLFQNNIEAICRSEKEIERQIVVTLFHELGHYFGMSERAVRAMLQDFE